MQSHQWLTQQLDRYVKERPCLMSAHWKADSFRSTQGEPMTLRRAKALNAVLDNCELPLWPGEMIIGCSRFHRMGRSGGRAPRDEAADAILLQEIGSRCFLEHFDHHAPDYPTLLELGFGGLRDRVHSSLAKHAHRERSDFLQSLEVAIDGASRFMRRYADRLSPGEDSEVMAHLSENPPRTFREAIQLVYSFHSMLQSDERCAMAFGRLDQYLYAFYSRDKAAGRIMDEGALGILEHFFAKITAEGDIQNITIGGVKPGDGGDATNDLSFLILEACKNVGRPGGNITARIHKHTAMVFLEKCAEVILYGSRLSGRGQ